MNVVGDIVSLALILHIGNSLIFVVIEEYSLFLAVFVLLDLPLEHMGQNGGGIDV
ncbi:hypothetical protein D3C87_1775430 [compost metagenome]